MAETLALISDYDTLFIDKKSLAEDQSVFV